MLKKAASITIEYQDILGDLSNLRMELYDCAEIPHVFDLLDQDNLLSTFENDRSQIEHSLTYMKETDQTLLFEETTKQLQVLWDKITQLSNRVAQINKSYVKIYKELEGSKARIAVTFLEQLHFLSHVANRYFQND